MRSTNNIQSATLSRVDSVMATSAGCWMATILS